MFVSLQQWGPLTLCILIDFSIFTATISTGLPILNFKGSQVEVSKLRCFSVPEGCNIKNSAGPDEMQHYAAFHLGLYCLPECSSIQMVIIVLQ